MEIQSLTSMILQEREKRLTLTKELVFEKQKVAQLEAFIDDFLNSKNFTEFNQDITKKEKELPVIGSYPYSIRQKKIRNYKLKVKKHRNRVKISRAFKGRSIAAKQKPRFNGKFAKTKDF